MTRGSIPAECSRALRVRSGLQRCAGERARLGARFLHSEASWRRCIRPHCGSSRPLYMGETARPCASMTPRPRTGASAAAPRARAPPAAWRESNERRRLPDGAVFGAARRPCGDVFLPLVQQQVGSGTRALPRPATFRMRPSAPPLPALRPEHARCSPRARAGVLGEARARAPRPRLKRPPCRAHGRRRRFVRSYGGRPSLPLSRRSAPGVRAERARRMDCACARAHRDARGLA